MDNLTKNWNRFLDTVLDWAPQLEYHAPDSQNVPEYATAGVGRGKIGVGKKVGLPSQ